MSVEEENKESIRRLTEEVCNNKNFSLLPEVVAEDFRSYGSEGEGMKGLDDFRLGIEMTFKAFPDFRYEIEDMFAVDDKLAVRYRLTGTHKGEWMGIPPTGKKFNTTSIYLCRMENGKQVEAWGCTDYLTFLNR